MTPTTALGDRRPSIAGTLEKFDLVADRDGFIAMRVLPVLEVAEDSGSFGLIEAGELLRNADTRRAPGSEYKRTQFSFGNNTYATQENGIEIPLDHRLLKMYRHWIDAAGAAVEIARDIVLRNMEKRVADMIFNATTWTGSSLFTSVTTEWSNAASGVPLTDVKNAKIKVKTATGMWPNALIISRAVFMHLQDSAQVIARIVASGAGNPAKPTDINTQMLAQVFDLPNIIVAGGALNTANEGQTATFGDMWDDEYAMVARISPGGQSLMPGLGRIFHWAEDGSQIGTTIEEYEENRTRSTIIRARHDTDEMVIDVNSGHLLGNISA